MLEGGTSMPPTQSSSEGSSQTPEAWLSSVVFPMPSWNCVYSCCTQLFKCWKLYRIFLFFLSSFSTWCWPSWRVLCLNNYISSQGLTCQSPVLKASPLFKLVFRWYEKDTSTNAYTHTFLHKQHTHMFTGRLWRC